MTEAVQATTTAQARRAGDALARAFSDDPVFAHLVPIGAPGRDRRMAAFFRFAAKGSLKRRALFVHPAGTSAATWRPPGRWQLPLSEIISGMPTMISALRTRIPVALSALDLVESKHPTEPHWYLEGLGTEPAAQGRGGGSLVLAPVLARCDADATPAYLESSKEQNIPFYERHGFRVTEEVALPKGGPPVWLMWRDPQAA